VTSWSDAEAQNFDRDKHLDYETRHERAAEFVEVVKGLWDTWDADAFVHDKQGGLFFDPAKLHVLNHRGKHFKVKGPLSVARSPQGRPVLVQAGASDAGMEIAAANAEVVYAVPHDLDTGRSYYTELKTRVVKHGRRPEELKILPGITPFIGKTEAEARETYDLLNALVALELGLSYLYAQMGDLSTYPLDGPVPEPNDPKVRSIAQNLLKLARRDNLTIRQLYTLIAAGLGSRIVIGTPAQIVDQMEAWVAAEAADGFNVCPPALPMGLADFAEMVVPELQRRGLYREEYSGRTLRDHLGVPVPPSRYPGALAVAR